MPVKSCTINGKSGYKWGDSGKCYTGPDAKQKASKQGAAIKQQQSKGTRMQQLLESIDKTLNKNRR